MERENIFIALLNDIIIIIILTLRLIDKIKKKKIKTINLSKYIKLLLARKPSKDYNLVKKSQNFKNPG